MPPRFGLFPVRSPLLGESRLISVPPGTEMFQFPGLASLAGWPVSPPVGFPHSVILGSRLVCSSPRLIAAYHDLHRLSMPRHPPCALLRLISNSIYDTRSRGHHSFRQTTRCDPPDGVDSSHPDLPVAREIKSSIHRLSKSASDPNPPTLATVPDPTRRSERERPARECGRLPRLFRPPSPKAGAYSRSPERR